MEVRRIKKYTKEDILEQLKYHYSKNPNMSGLSFGNDKEVSSVKTVKRIFGSWSNALKAAEIPEKEKLTKKDIIFQLKAFYKKNSRISSHSFEKDKRFCSPNTVSYHFGSWGEALKEAGLREEKSYVEYDKEKLLIVLKKKVKTGELRYRTDIGKLEGVPSWTYVSQLWTWDELVKILKLNRRVYAYTDDEIIEKYNKLKKKKKYKKERITSEIMTKETGVSMEAIRLHFGNWNKFLELIKENDILRMTKVLHTDEEILEMYRDFSIKIGKDGYGATGKDLKKKGFPYKVNVLRIRFKSLNNMRKLLGFKMNRGYSVYTKEILTKILLEKYKEYGRRLTQNEMREINKKYKNDKEKKLPGMSTFLAYFKTTKMSKVWEEVLKEKGL